MRLTKKQRAALEAEVERLIAVLDEADGDADLEPSLGWDEYCTRASLRARDDREEEHDGREPQGDDEPDDSGIGDRGGFEEQIPLVGEVLHFTGRGVWEARGLLRRTRRRRKGARIGAVPVLPPPLAIEEVR